MSKTHAGKSFKWIAVILCCCLLFGFAVGFGGSVAVRLYRIEQRVYVLPDGFTVTAHTGCMGTKDNSLEAIKLGAQNADIVEFDVSFNNSGIPVLFHGTEPPADAVTLSQAFKLLAEFPNVQANVDLKETDDLAEVQRLAEQWGVTEQIFFTGVELEEVAVVKEFAPAIRFYLNVDVEKSKNKEPTYINEIVENIQSSGALGLNANFKNVSAELVYAVRESGHLISLWTVKSKLQADEALRLAPDNLTTRIPDTVNALLQKGA